MKVNILMGKEDYKTDLSKHVSINTQTDRNGFYEVFKMYCLIINANSEATM